MSFRGLLSVVFTALLFSTGSSRGQVAFHMMEPAFGPPGTQVLLAASGLPETGPLTVNVGGANATIVERSPQFVRFTIPSAALIGPVTVASGGETNVVDTPFSVTRVLTAQIAPQTQIVASNYLVGTLYGDAPGTGPNYPVQVAVGEVTLTAASGGETDPVLMAIHTDEQDTIVLHAESTALALLYLIPGVANADPIEGKHRLDFLRGRTELARLAGAIQERLNARQDYLDDPVVEQWMIAALEAFDREYEPLPQESSETQLRSLNFLAAAPERLAVGFPRDLEAPGYPGLPKLTSSSGDTGINEQGAPFIKVRVASKKDRLVNRFKHNPLDWMANLYELDPNDPNLDTFNKARALAGDFSQPYQRLNPQPLDRLHIKASLAFRALDVPEVGADLLMGWVTPEFLKPKDYLEVPADRPGLYLVRAFSGARFPPQGELIAQLPGGRREDNVMMALNIVLASQDGLSFLAKELSGSDCKTKFFMSLIVSTLQVVERESAQGEISGEVIKALVLNAAKSFVKDYFVKCVLLKPNPKDLGAMAGTRKAADKGLSVLGKIATVGKVLERGNALANFAGSGGAPGTQRLWTAQAIEDTIIVVGNPWQPRITSFLPQEGNRGALVWVHGRNFSRATNENIVTFGVFSTDPENPSAPARAEVLAASESTLVVRVPEGARTGPISVTVAGKGTASTTSLEPPFHQFHFLGFPEISGVFPNPARPGKMVELRGTGFDNFVARDYQILIDGAPAAYGQGGDATHLGVHLPGNLSPGTHTLAIKVHNFQTPPISFQVENLPYIQTPGRGYTINVTVGDFSNAADGKVSVLEAILIAKGQLGRPIEEHLPCELTGDCVFREREIDHVQGEFGGAGMVDTVFFPGELVVSGAVPPLSPGDRFVFGDGGGGVVFDGAAAGAVDGLLLDGLSGVHVSGSLTLRNFQRHGVHLLNGANENLFENVAVQNCGGNGFFLEGSARWNELRHISVTNAAGHGVHFSGAEVWLNTVSSTKGGFTGGIHNPYDVIANCGGNGIRLDNGAHNNWINPGSIRDCHGAGIFVAGIGTRANLVGRQSDESRDSYPISSTINGPGAYIGPGAVGNIFRYLNPVGNQGSGILIEGPGCSNNIIDRTFAGVNHFHGGDSKTNGNHGSGIHLRAGAQFNLVGSKNGSLLGELGSISANRDDGILIEGVDTAHNRVNSQVISLLNAPFHFPYRYARNGRAGIAIRGGARENVIGDWNSDYANIIFSSNTAIEIAGNQSDRNLVIGNLINVYRHVAFGRVQFIVTDQGEECGNGIWIHDGPRGNIIGVKGKMIALPHYPGDDRPAFICGYNLIETCLNAGVLLENAAGEVGTDGVLSSANVIEGNHIGELDGCEVPDNCQLAPPGHTGIKLGTGAHSNIIRDNRIRGWYHAGVWIDKNNVAGPLLRNRFENNYVEGQIFTGNQPAYLTENPWGAGFLVTASTGHTIGESLQLPNVLRYNRIGVYVGDSSGITVRGFKLIESFNSGIAIRGGSGNKIGGAAANEGNLVHGSGIGGAWPWSGIALSHTSGNQLRGNEVGFFLPSDGSIGIVVTNASNNIIGGPAKMDGNTVISNRSHGILLTGSATSGNKLYNNYIGVDSSGKPYPNGRDGVRIENGARQNEVGGLAFFKNAGVPGMIAAGNTIRGNLDDGVRVEGGAALGNSIMNNSISGHIGGMGIRNSNGGNTEILPPRLTTFDGLNVVGSVTAGIPDGSRVQFFSDPGDEGLTYMPIGDTLVVGSEFQFILPLGAGPRINATVTHALAWHTSEFAQLVARSETNRAALFVRRLTRPPATIPMPIPGAGVALAFGVRSAEEPVVVSSIAFNATGSADESLAGVFAYLYRDDDRNALLSSADSFLAGPGTFSSNNGSVTFTSFGRIIDPGAEQTWFLVIVPATNTPAGQTFSFEIPTAAFITARALVSGEHVTASGELPLVSDTLQVAISSLPPEGLKIARSNDGRLTLAWTGSALLETAREVTGPWDIVPNSSSPFSFTPDESQQFFRFRR